MYPVENRHDPRELSQILQGLIQDSLCSQEVEHRRLGKILRRKQKIFRGNGGASGDKNFPSFAKRRIRRWKFYDPRSPK